LRAIHFHESPQCALSLAGPFGRGRGLRIAPLPTDFDCSAASHMLGLVEEAQESRQARARVLGPTERRNAAPHKSEARPQPTAREDSQAYKRRLTAYAEPLERPLTSSRASMRLCRKCCRKRSTVSLRATLERRCAPLESESRGHLRKPRATRPTSDIRAHTPLNRCDL